MGGRAKAHEASLLAFWVPDNLLHREVEGDTGSFFFKWPSLLVLNKPIQTTFNSHLFPSVKVSLFCNLLCNLPILTLSLSASIFSLLLPCLSVFEADLI